MKLTNPWDAEDTTVISPFKDEDDEYEAEDEGIAEDCDDEDDWDDAQRSEFAAIESLLRPKSEGCAKQPAPSIRSEADESVYSQG